MCNTYIFCTLSYFKDKRYITIYYQYYLFRDILEVLKHSHGVGLKSYNTISYHVTRIWMVPMTSRDLEVSTETNKTTLIRSTAPLHLISDFSRSLVQWHISMGFYSVRIYSYSVFLWKKRIATCNTPAWG